MNILVVGSIALDTIETPYGSVKDSPGGSALYFSSAASLFAPVNIVGVVGEDFNFELIKFLQKRLTNLDGIYTDKGKTFRWGGRYYKNLNRRDTLFTHLNVFENFKPVIPDYYKKSQLIFLANIAPALQLQVLEQIENPRLVILDTMNFWINGYRSDLLKVIQHCDVLILNDEETLELSGDDNIIKAGSKILDMGPKYLIIKKGEHGAVLISKNTYFTAPAFPLLRVIDPTGAGDSFAGGFVGYLAKSRKYSEVNMRKALVYGNIVASFNVEDFSFRNLISLNREKLMERYRQYKNFTCY